MEDELQQLKEILTKISNVPKRARKNIIVHQIKPSDKTIFKEQTDSTNFPSGSDLLLQKEAEELRRKSNTLEIAIEEYKKQIKSLQVTNTSLKANEKTLKEAIFNARGSIRVLCRIKPTKNTNKIIINDKEVFADERGYLLDRVLDPLASQEEVFSEIQTEIEGVMDGYSVCIFAYGQTGSGKTYTMTGDDKNEGIVFLALQKIKASADNLIKEGFKVVFSIKYVEVYNENIKDLISGKQCTIVHDITSIKIKDCDEVATSNIEEIYNKIKIAGAKRRTEETNCNSKSSRSHSVCILKVVMTREDECRIGKLCLIDLAGSERLDSSKAENERLKETQFINRSLSALGNVIVALKRKDKHIPFRDSKLTHLMQEYLVGKSRVSMMVNVNPECLNETVCSLRFATKVSECHLGHAGRTVSKIV
ncbi:hypothetical protein GINT2_001094 [Glugoides intestinalis]